MKEINFLMKLLRDYIFFILLSVITGFLTILSGTGLLSISAYLIAASALHPPLYTLQLAITGVRFFGFTRGFFRYGERVTSHNTTFMILSRLRYVIFRGAYHRYPYGIKTVNMGDRLSRMIGDVESLENFFVRSVHPPFVFILTLIGSFIFFSSFSIRIAYWTTLLLLGGAVILVVVTLYMVSKKREIRKSFSMISVKVMDAVMGAMEMFISGYGKSYLKDFEKVVKGFEKKRKFIASTDGFNVLLLIFYAGFTMVILIFIAAGERIDGIIKGVSIIVVAIAYYSMYESVLPLSGAAEIFYENLEAATRLIPFVINEGESETISEEACKKEIGENYEIVISELSFGYAEEKLLFEAVNLKIEEGERVALVGPSGSGKSTLLSLMAGLWKPLKGEVKIGGVSPHTCPVYEVVGVLPQDVYIFYDSVRNNIGLGVVEDREVIHYAIRKVYLDNFVRRLPEGMDTLLGPDGYRVSGGEAKRIGIARLFTRDYRVLLLDEPFEYLDRETAEKILENLFNSFPHSTIITATHDMKIVEKFDRIIVVAGGKIVEDGRFKDLLAINGAFAKMVRFYRMMVG